MFQRRKPLRALAAAILVTGVACQFVQRTDATPPLLYFTVDAALLAAATALWSLRPGDRPAGVWTERTRVAAVVGVLFSALVYAGVIAPTSPSGTWFAAHDDLWVRTATVLLHGVAPVLVLADFLVGPCTLPASLREATWVLIWPTAYLASVGTLAWAGAATMPYPFLRPSETGLLGTAAAVVVLAATVVGSAVAVVASHHRLHRDDGSAQAVPEAGAAPMPRRRGRLRRPG